MNAEEGLSMINQAALEETSEVDLSGLGLRSLLPQVLSARQNSWLCCFSYLDAITGYSDSDLPR